MRPAEAGLPHGNKSGSTTLPFSESSPKVKMLLVAACWNAGEHASAMPLATQPIRRMRGRPQSHLMRCADENFYVVKFQNNPQGWRILANEYERGERAIPPRGETGWGT